MNVLVVRWKVLGWIERRKKMKKLKWKGTLIPGECFYYYYYYFGEGRLMGFFFLIGLPRCRVMLLRMGVLYKVEMSLRWVVLTWICLVNDNVIIVNSNNLLLYPLRMMMLNRTRSLKVKETTRKRKKK